MNKIFTLMLLLFMFLFIGCGSMDKKLDGVWRGEKSDLMLVINFNSQPMYIKVNDEYYRVITKDVVSNNTAVVVKVIGNKKQEVWTFRASWEDYTRSYSFFWKKEDGFEDKLLFIRSL